MIIKCSLYHVWFHELDGLCSGIEQNPYYYNTHSIMVRVCAVRGAGGEDVVAKLAHVPSIAGAPHVHYLAYTDAKLVSS